MKIKLPKKIDYALSMRTKAAVAFAHWDFILSSWLDKKEICVDACDDFRGCESIYNPHDSEQRLRVLIEIDGKYD